MVGWLHRSVDLHCFETLLGIRFRLERQVFPLASDKSSSSENQIYSPRCLWQQKPKIKLVKVFNSNRHVNRKIPTKCFSI